MLTGDGLLVLELKACWNVVSGELDKTKYIGRGALLTAFALRIECPAKQIFFSRPEPNSSIYIYTQISQKTWATAIASAYLRGCLYHTPRSTSSRLPFGRSVSHTEFLELPVREHFTRKGFRGTRQSRDLKHRAFNVPPSCLLRSLASIDCY